VLLHLMSVEDINLDDPMAGFAVVDEELVRFDPELAKRPQLRVFNKIDLLPPQQRDQLAHTVHQDAFLISALNRTGLEALMAAVSRLVHPDTQE